MCQLPGKWEPGDVIDFEIPLEVQLVTSDEKVSANKDEVALRYGPLIYCVEKEDQDISKTISTENITPEWKGDLLGGLMVLNGKWNDNSPMMAIPYYARNNRSVYSNDDRSDKSKVWITAN